MDNTIEVALIAGLFALAGSALGTADSFIQARQLRKKEKIQRRYEETKSLTERRMEIYAELLTAMRKGIDEAKMYEYENYDDSRRVYLDMFGSKEVLALQQKYDNLFSAIGKARSNGSAAEKLEDDLFETYQKTLLQIRNEVNMT